MCFLERLCILFIIIKYIKKAGINLSYKCFCCVVMVVVLLLINDGS